MVSVSKYRGTIRYPYETLKVSKYRLMNEWFVFLPELIHLLNFLYNDLKSHPNTIAILNLYKLDSQQSVKYNSGIVWYRRNRGTVEPLSNDHPHQRPSLLYDHILCDRQCFLFVRSLTDDHPSDVTNDRVKWDCLPRERPPRLQCISKNRGWRFNIRSQWWIITMLFLDTFQVIQLL